MRCWRRQRSDGGDKCGSGGEKRAKGRRGMRRGLEGFGLEERHGRGGGAAAARGEARPVIREPHRRPGEERERGIRRRLGFGSGGGLSAKCHLLGVI